MGLPSGEGWTSIYCDHVGLRLLKSKAEGVWCSPRGWRASPWGRPETGIPTHLGSCCSRCLPPSVPPQLHSGSPAMCGSHTHTFTHTKTDKHVHRHRRKHTHTHTHTTYNNSLYIFNENRVSNRFLIVFLLPDNRQCPAPARWDRMGSCCRPAGIWFWHSGTVRGTPTT